MQAHRAPWPILGAAILLGSLAACNPQAVADTTEAGATIRPKAGPGIVLMQVATRKNELEAQASSPPRLSLGNEYTIHSTLEGNLDIDSVNEQIILARHQGDGEDSARVLIADRTASDATWFLAWEGTVRVGTLQSLAIQVLDMTGRHDNCLVLSGSLRDGSPTMNILQARSDGGVLTMNTILALSADLEITIETAPRPVDYEDGVSPAPDFPVIAINRDSSRSASSDMIRATYRYSLADNRYELSATTPLSTSIAAGARLGQVFRGSTADVEEFMAGAWTRRIAGVSQTIFFDTEERMVRMVESDRLESHYWTVTQKSPSLPRIQLHMTNELLYTIKSVLMIAFNSPDEMTITLQNRPEWTGSFVRLKVEEAGRLMAHKRVRAQLQPLVLSGLYSGENGYEVIFTNQDFLVRTAGKEESGTFVCFGLRDLNILTLGFKDRQGRVVRSSNFRITFKEEVQAEQVRRTLELLPVHLLASAVVTTGDDAIRLVQSRKIE